MPIYEYECKKCGHHQDEYHGITATPEVKCEECNGACEKQFVPACNYILKGSGWASKEFKMKDEMTKKNQKMKGVMKEREVGGEGVSSMKDLKKL